MKQVIRLRTPRDNTVALVLLRSSAWHACDSSPQRTCAGAAENLSTNCPHGRRLQVIEQGKWLLDNTAAAKEACVGYVCLFAERASSALIRGRCCFCFCCCCRCCRPSSLLLLARSSSDRATPVDPTRSFVAGCGVCATVPLPPCSFPASRGRCACVCLGGVHASHARAGASSCGARSTAPSTRVQAPTPFPRCVHPPPRRRRPLCVCVYVCSCVARCVQARACLPQCAHPPPSHPRALTQHAYTQHGYIQTRAHSTRPR